VGSLSPLPCHLLRRRCDGVGRCESTSSGADDGRHLRARCPEHVDAVDLHRVAKPGSHAPPRLAPRRLHRPPERPRLGRRPDRGARGPHPATYPCCDL